MPSPDLPDPFLLKGAEQPPVLVLPLDRDCLQDGNRAERWLQDSREAISAAKVSRVILDCEQVGVTCGSGLGKLLRLYKDLLAGHGRLALCNLSRPLAEIVQVTRIDKVFAVERDLEAAYARLAKAPGP